MIRCIVCSEEIDQDRVEIFAIGGKVPQTCVRHSREKKYVGITVYAHKTGGETVLVNPNNKEDLRRAKRFVNRAR